MFDSEPDFNTRKMKISPINVFFAKTITFSYLIGDVLVFLSHFFISMLLGSYSPIAAKQFIRFY
jgi:hypothetical protein